MPLWIARPSWAGTDQLSLIVSALSLLVALAVVLVGPLRKIAVGLFDRILILLGSTRRRYARWFLKEHGTLKNVYLDRTEELNLVSTYVPLNVYAESHPDRIPATRVLADPKRTRVLIIGDPGSGKSTLLKAYGTGLRAPGAATRAGTPPTSRRSCTAARSRSWYHCATSPDTSKAATAGRPAA